MVSDRDKGMRGAALAILERLHAAVGPHSAWSLLGPLKDQQRSLIEERIRHRERHPDAPNGVTNSAAAAASTSYVSHWCARMVPCCQSAAVHASGPVQAYSRKSFHICLSCTNHMVLPVSWDVIRRPHNLG